MRVSDEKLRSAGLSGAKVLAFRDLARRTLDGAVPTLEEARDLDDETIIECLTEVRGVGRWTAGMFLIFRLGRPDVLPVNDYTLRRGFAIAFKKKELPDVERSPGGGSGGRPTGQLRAGTCRTPPRNNHERGSGNEATRHRLSENR